jgi:isoleucyl-tRNA synthetase
MPILTFTAEEVWGHMPGEREESVLFATHYQALQEVPEDAAADSQWATVIAVRNEVAKRIEALRTEGKIGAALDANVKIFAQGQCFEALAAIESELRFVLITSGAELADYSQASSNALQTELADLKIAVEPVDDQKCVRCWHRRPEVGQITAHPELCERCVENVDGAGETRLYA